MKFQKNHIEPFPVTDNIHPWMKGFVFPRPNPYVAVTDAQGKFWIDDLPAGKREFFVWHEINGSLSAKPEWTNGRVEVEIADGEVTDLGTILVAPAHFERERR